jgi:hypothetical protein
MCPTNLGPGQTTIRSDSYLIVTIYEGQYFDRIIVTNVRLKDILKWTRRTQNFYLLLFALPTVASFKKIRNIAFHLYLWMKHYHYKLYI